jgi:type I restriction enzyme M protein
VGQRRRRWPDDDAEERRRRKKGLPEKKRKKLLDPKTWERDGRLVEVATALREALGDGSSKTTTSSATASTRPEEGRHQAACRRAEADPQGRELARRDRAPVIAKVHKPGKLTADPMLGLYDAVVAGKSCVVEYEPDADLRDTEQVPLLEEGGIEAFIRREVLPYTPDAWVNNDATKIGYEVSFTRHFYKPQPLRTLAEISADILAIEKEAEGLLDGLLVEATQP